MGIVLTVIGTIIGLVIAYLAAIIFLPIMKVEEQDINVAKQRKKAPDCREDVFFDVDGMKISGWFYKQQGVNLAPCVVMSHGFGGTKDMALEKYALKFVQSGFAVLIYDDRYFGESEGIPRQVYSAVYQIDDLKAAISYVKSRDDVDGNKIILWGTSAGANYGVLVASKDKTIAGVIAQCGAFDHKEDSKLYLDQEGMGFFLKLLMHGQRDKGRARFGLSPHSEMTCVLGWR